MVARRKSRKQRRRDDRTTARGRCRGGKRRTQEETARKPCEWVRSTKRARSWNDGCRTFKRGMCREPGCMADRDTVGGAETSKKKRVNARGKQAYEAGPVANGMLSTRTQTPANGERPRNSHEKT
ncbi:hypothetical protein R1flu_000316 [Riccia fluitans]|uniref:Uncharacterized protein n=1 Tax=Riccia fluitans TaxID=41844 RepID=A0ABD1Y035_9MARC